jgi:Flp pilus assembly protein TadD
MNRDLDQAIALFLETTARDSTNPICRNDLATALMLAERRDEAVAEWEKALTLDPDPSLGQVIRQNLERARGD